MRAVWDAFWAGLVGASFIEQSATITGILGVWLMIRRSLWAFPVGLLQVSLSAVVFYQARFFADMKLQGVFFVALAYGWWHWTRVPSGEHKELPVSRLGIRGWLGWILAGLLGTALWGWYLQANTTAAMPYRDSFIASFSIVAQWLQSRKVLENWFGWILVNLVAVPVYWLGGMPWFSFLYLLFLIMAVGGYREWRKALAGQGSA